ncbi:muconolactone Delta-isomerase family protein [Streptomyces sp. NPDC051217]|uniref:muconolactone Delta-isomerase family protein n=1 Tax=Streptomyces sp. NPDC051217 TaxID=3365644 RepID=UPI0037933DC9
MEEFLVEMRTTLPDDLTPDTRTRLELGEAATINRYAHEGRVKRLWRTSDGDGPYTVGFWLADGEAELRHLLGKLPLHPWMHVTVRPLTPHRFDPAKAI